MLLGLHHSSNSSKHKHSLSPAPAPIEEEALVPAPSPVSFYPHHVYTSSSFHHKKHNPAPHHSIDGGRKRRRRRRDERDQIHRVIIAVSAAAGSILAVGLSVAIFLACRSCRRRRNQTSLSFKNKVSCDPDSGPELFYLHSLTPIADIESSCKLSSQSKNTLSVESMSSYNASLDEGIHQKSSSRSSESEKIETSKELDGESDKLKSDASVTDMDEEILQIELPNSSDDEIFHSVCTSRNSFASEMSFSCASGRCSPFYASYGSSSPLTPPPPPPPLPPPLLPPKSSAFAHPFPSIPKTRSPPIPSIGNGGSSRPPPPPFPKSSAFTHSFSSTTKTTSPPIPSISNGGSSRPPPPPPPSPPPFQPPSSQNGSNLRIAPPPPPSPFPQSTPIGKDGTPLPKLKPLHWDKVRAAPDRSMVWDKIKSSSFEYA